MFVYEPADLKDRLYVAIEKLDFLSGYIVDDIEFGDILGGDTCDDEEIILITEDTPIYLNLWDGDYPSTTLGFFLNIMKNMNTAKLNDRQSYAKNTYEVDFLLTVNDYETCMILAGLERSDNHVVNKSPVGIELWKVESVVDGIKYEIALFKGVCLYHILVEQSGNYDEYNPSYTDSDYFVRIVSSDKIDMAVCDNLAISFIFELQSTHKIILEFSNGRANSEDKCSSDDDFSDKPYGIFPLIYGRGLREILSLYNKAKSTLDYDYKILNYTKVLEYISPTIAQQQLYEQVRLKLSSPTILSPTSDYINELGAIYSKNQSDITKDSKLLRLAVITVTDLNDIWNDVSIFMKNNKSKKIQDMDDSDKRDCLEILATIIYDTRNEIAHAKANYAKTGNECAEKYKSQFGDALDKIAVRCIRWFALQTDNKRVTFSCENS